MKAFKKIPKQFKTCSKTVQQQKKCFKMRRHKRFSPNYRWNMNFCCLQCLTNSNLFDFVAYWRQQNLSSKMLQTKLFCYGRRWNSSMRFAKKHLFVAVANENSPFFNFGEKKSKCASINLLLRYILVEKSILKAL